MIREAVVDQTEIRISIHDLPGKVALEKSIVVAAVRYRNRAGIVILADQEIARRSAVQFIVDQGKLFWIDVNKYALDQRQLGSVGRRVIQDRTAEHVRCADFVPK